MGVSRRRRRCRLVGGGTIPAGELSTSVSTARNGHLASRDDHRPARRRRVGGESGGAQEEIFVRADGGSDRRRGGLPRRGSATAEIQRTALRRTREHTRQSGAANAGNRDRAGTAART